jgi:hypothetical protein
MPAFRIVQYRNKVTPVKSSIQMLRFWNEMLDAGIPKPVAAASMPMPSYASQCTTNLATLHPMRWMHPNVLLYTLLSYAGPYIASLPT